MALNCVPMMPRDASLSDSYASDRWCFFSPVSNFGGAKFGDANFLENYFPARHKIGFMNLNCTPILRDTRASLESDDNISILIIDNEILVFDIRHSLKVEPMKCSGEPSECQK